MSRLEELRQQFKAAFKEEDFDSNWGYMLRSVCQDIDSVFDRVQDCLKDRTDDELDVASDYLWFIGNEIEERLQSEEPNIQQHDAPYVESFYAKGPNLVEYIEEFDISNIEGFLHATWKEFFAIQALGMLEDASLAWTMLVSSKVPDSQKLIYSLELIFMIGVAIEAVTHAEMIERNMMKVEEGTKEKIRLSNQRAGKIRHARTDEIKEKFLAFYAGQDFRSKADAARKFWDTLTLEEKKRFSPDNWQRTFCEWLPKIKQQ